MIQIPTDSFYKFFALSGLSLVISVFFLMGWYGLILSSEVDISKQKSKKSQIQHYLKQEIREKETFEEEEIRESHLVITGIRIIKLGNQPELFKENMISAKKQGLISIRLKIKHKEENIERLAKLIDRIEVKNSHPIMSYGFSVVATQIYMHILLTVGVFSSVFGFNRWYRLHQLYHDELLIIQVKEARKNYNKAFKPTK
jgi:hypothetical protein